MTTEVLKDGVVRETTATEYVELTPDELAQRAEFDRLLAGVEESRKAQAYTLAELLGQPVAYEPIPGLYYAKPKLGHKMDVQRQYNRIMDGMRESEDPEEIVNALIGLVLPFAFVEGEDGAVRPATAQELSYKYFDDPEDVDQFAARLLKSKRELLAELEGAEGEAKNP